MGNEPISVDIHGQMEDQDQEEAGVEVVRPGEQPAEEGDWHTLYFFTCVHDIRPNYTVHSDRWYYIPGETVVYGTLTNDDYDDRNNVTIHIGGTHVDEGGMLILAKV